MKKGPLSNRERGVSILAAVLLGALLVLDMQTRIGIADWALYVLPVAVTLFQPRRWLPVLVAVLATAFNLIGLALSPPGASPAIALLNRCISIGSIWILAAIIINVIVTRARAQRLSWMQQSEASVSQRLLGELTISDVARNAAQATCDVLGAPTAVVYRRDGAGLVLAGGHALDSASCAPRIALGEGLAGQVGADGRARVLSGLPDGHLAVRSGLGSSAPQHVIAAPLTADGEAQGVIEVGFTGPHEDLAGAQALLEALGAIIGIALRSAAYRERVQALLEETQRQSEELQAQQEELRVSNEELEQQSRVLRESQARLETQQVELEQTNTQLEEQAQSLQRQKADLQIAQAAAEANARQLEAASRYKSEFLANMSHELRTPLNSALILSKLLTDNKEGTLTGEQVKYARAIHDSNNDLLALINDILDLSKIESGHADFHAEEVPIGGVLERLRATFEPLAMQKGLAFATETAPGVPAQLVTDSQRLQQILKNLLANAVKFTERGGVRLRVVPRPGGRVAFEVHDSGLGIPLHQQEVIFEAFRQADGSTSRRFGGTGLGLSISRELATRLGGSIRVDSEPGRGSCFTVELPSVFDATLQPVAAPAQAPAVAVAPPPAAPAVAAAPSVADDRARRQHPGRLILVVEDDPRFAQLVYDLAHELGFDCAVAHTGAEAIQLARELQPSGILLDIGLPDQSGLGVLERLKRDPQTRHLPVHVCSLHERTHSALELGAVGYLQKPPTRDQLAQAIERLQQRTQSPLRRVLIVEDDAELRDNLALLLAAPQVEIAAVGSMADALARLEAQTFDCMVMDLSLPDGSGDELLERMAEGERYGFPPVIVYTGRTLSRDEEQRLRKHSQSIIVKGARSPERLLDEVTLFLHSVEASLPAEQQRLLRQARQRDAVLDGRRILIAEDDVRNVFALSSIFEPLGAQLVVARNGREALEKLESGPDADLVLMDLMMPEMDGLEAMRRIRAQPRFAALPIIALTAKAMPDDRSQCIEAGASDYLAKPIDVDKLVSLARVWMPR